MKKSSLVKIAFFLGVLLLPLGGTSYAYHNDQEDIDENNFQTGTLEIELSEVSEVDDTEDLVSPSESVERYYHIENVGTGDFVYGLGAEKFGGDTDFCNDIKVKVYLLDAADPSESKYEGDLKDLFVNEDGSDEEMMLDGGGDSDLRLKYYLPDTADSADSLDTCEFVIIAKAWMPKYEFGKAYYDSSDISQELGAGDWLIEMGYESKETLEDDTDGDPPLGFCNIRTEDRSDDDTAEQQIKWEKVEGADKYVLHMFVQDTEWLPVSTTEVLLTDPNLSEDAGIMTYEATVLGEGVYGYYIQAFNSDDELIGATTPSKDAFTCTFEVVWEEEEEEEKEEEHEILVIDPLVELLQAGPVPESSESASLGDGSE